MCSTALSLYPLIKYMMIRIHNHKVVTSALKLMTNYISALMHVAAVYVASKTQGLYIVVSPNVIDTHLDLTT